VSSVSPELTQFGGSRKSGDAAPTSALCGCLSLFSGILSTERDWIVSAARQRRLSRRETIFREGDSIREVTLLLVGCVKLTQVGTSGREVILRIIRTGELVGALQPSSLDKQHSTAQAVEASVVLMWNSAVFDALQGRFQLFRRNVVRGLEDQLRKMDSRFREVSTERVRIRLSSELIRLSNGEGEVSNRNKIRLSRTELAQLTGTTLSTVSRLFSEWRKVGVVRLDRDGVFVEDPAALLRLCQDE
jgi:CRP-like cAMP-binding protein